MNYFIRKATPDDIRPALDLAYRVFEVFEAPDYEPEALQHFREDIVENRAFADAVASGENAMFLAFTEDILVGIAASRGAAHLSILFVESTYHRHGIGTALMNRMVCELKLRGSEQITLNSSPFGLPFYKHFGFIPTDVEQKRDGFLFTPMVYTPNEIWDVLDKDRNQTGRFAERDRALPPDDYHLVVNIWKYNKRGEWLIDKRAPRGQKLDGKWETTGGSAVAGDSSLEAALRETREELGIELDPQAGVLFHSDSMVAEDGHGWHRDAWVFEANIPIETIRLQEGETCEAKWATTDEIREMMKSGDFLGEYFYPYFEEMVEKWSRVC